MRPGIRRAFSIAAAAALAGALSIGTTFAQGKPDIRIATGRQGGAYYNMGALVADALYRSGKVSSATAESASGGIEGLRLAAKGTVQLAAADKVWVLRARNGEKPFNKKLDIVTVAPLGVWQLFFVTEADSPIKSLADMKGKRIAVGAKGSGMENHARAILGALGWTFNDFTPVYLSFGPGARAVRDGKADAQLQCCLPNPSMTELSELSNVRVVDMSHSLKTIVTKAPIYDESMLPKGAFKGLNHAVPAIGDLNGWMASSKLDDHTAYLIAKTIIDNVNKLAKKMPQFESIKALFAKAKTEGVKALEIGAPLHPGAIKAFREAGILK